jgi:predicted dehydrogenase
MGCGVVGYGYWGPNIVRNVIESHDMRLLGVCETDHRRAKEFERRHPGIAVTQQLDELLLDPRVEAVCIATPPATHHALAQRALQAGKHVLVEKPLAMTVAEAEELIAQADELGLVLMPGHTFLYSPPVDKIRELIQSGELGETYFVTSSRMNLGLYQDGGVILDLAPHDISILLYWFDSQVVQVSAAAQSVFQTGIPETAFLTIDFANEATANVQISWLAPRKVRQMVVVGSRRMVQYDDTAADDVVRIYDRGMEFESPSSFGEYKLTYRAGDMVAPRIPAAEPLALEVADFAHAIRTGEPPRSDAQLGLEVVRALEAAHASLDSGGLPVQRDLQLPSSYESHNGFSDELSVA